MDKKKKKKFNGPQKKKTEDILTYNILLDDILEEKIYIEYFPKAKKQTICGLSLV